MAGHFLAASVDASQQGDFWSKAASNVLSQLFLAAANDNRPITDVMTWLAFPADRTPLDILRDHHFGPVAAQLKGTVEGPPETRDGIYETARQYAACLLNTDIAAWVTPQTGIAEFDPAKFVGSRDTLYLLSKDGGGGASALIAACADAVMRTATTAAERAAWAARPARAVHPRRGRQRLQDQRPPRPVLPPRLPRNHPDHDPAVLPPGPESLGRCRYGRHVVRRHHQGHRQRDRRP